MPEAVSLVLIPAVLVFVVALLGNLVSFDNRPVNALVTAVIVALIWEVWALTTHSVEPSIVSVILAAGAVFIADLIGNAITFTNRYTNALATAVVFVVIFLGGFYVLAMLLGPNFHGAGGG